MYYNYFDEMKKDVKNYIDENVDIDSLKEEIELDFYDTYDKLYDEMWAEDSVTGNASGSYTFNSYKAREYVIDNNEILYNAISEFGIPLGKVANAFIKGDWEYFDVSIRCYMLGQVLTSVLEDIEEETEAGDKQ